MKTNVLVLCFCLMIGTVSAQKGERQEKIQAAKVSLITNRLNLSAEQAKEFWPIFEEYDTQKIQIHRRLRAINSEGNNLTATDETVKKSLKEMLDLRQKEVDIEREYMTKFQKVINVRQLAELYKTEHRLKLLLIEELRRRGDRPPRD